MPSNIEIEEKIAQILNASYRKILQFVHRSLTRKILVFIRVVHRKHQDFNIGMNGNLNIGGSGILMINQVF